MKSRTLINWKASIAIGWMCWSAVNVCIAQTPSVLSPALQHVLTLSKGGLSDDVIIAYITTSTNSSSAYALNDDTLIFLHKQGASDAVIKTLLQASSSSDSSPTPNMGNTAAMPSPPDANPTAPVAGPIARFLPPPVSTAARLNEGLLAYYPFNGNANDQSGNGNDGTIYGAVFETYAPGQTALRFDGMADTYVIVSRSASLEPQDAITVSLWCRGVSGPGQTYGTILRKADNCGPGYFMRTGDSSSSGIPETFRLDPPNPCSGATSCVGSFAIPTDASWQYFAATYSSTDGLKTYVNGELVSQAPPIGQLQHSGNMFIGGATVHDQDGGFNGLINDVRIYNRALRLGEIRAIYHHESHTH